MKSVSESRREGDGLARDELDERTRQEYSLGGDAAESVDHPEVREQILANARYLNGDESPAVLRRYVRALLCIIDTGAPLSLSREERLTLARSAIVLEGVDRPELAAAVQEILKRTDRECPEPPTTLVIGHHTKRSPSHSPDFCADPECDERMFGATAMKSPTGGVWAYWSDDGQLLTIVRPNGERAHVCLDDNEFTAWQKSGAGDLAGMVSIPFPGEQLLPTAAVDTCPRCQRSISGALKRETAMDILGLVCGAIVALGFGLAVLVGVVIGVIWAIRQVLA